MLVPRLREWTLRIQARRRLGRKRTVGVSLGTFVTLLGAARDGGGRLPLVITHLETLSLRA